jgi:hypothetical protein
MKTWTDTPSAPHPVFHAVFRDWHARAGVFSAQPGAPVVCDRASRNWGLPMSRRASTAMTAAVHRVRGWFSVIGTSVSHLGER